MEPGQREIDKIDEALGDMERLAEFVIQYDGDAVKFANTVKTRVRYIRSLLMEVPDV